MSIKIEDLSKEIMKGLNEYRDMASDTIKTAVKHAGSSTKKEIEKTAPKDRGKYAKSWKVKKTKETANSLEVIVHSSLYQLPHLLEFGHAKRNGGRTRAYPHIEKAKDMAIKKMEEEILKGLGK